VEMTADRALDEGYYLKDQVKHLQEERKKDVEDTAGFIKQVIAGSKSEIFTEINKVYGEMDRLRRELSEKSAISELLDLKSKVFTQLEQKPDLKEVQTALNECQKDISGQLTEFRKQIKGEVHQIDSELHKVLERKANVIDVQDGLAKKADSWEMAQFAPRQDLEFCKEKFDKIEGDLQRKVDTREFEDYQEHQYRKYDEIQSALLQKSNIKDVCALLDMKSNIDDVNKALQDLNDDMEGRVSQ